MRDAENVQINLIKLAGGVRLLRFTGGASDFGSAGNAH
jgi:hypothetical protein